MRTDIRPNLIHKTGNLCGYFTTQIKQLKRILPRILN
jgi:hypothetical protein